MTIFDCIEQEQTTRKKMQIIEKNAFFHPQTANFPKLEQLNPMKLMDFNPNQGVKFAL